MILLLCGSCTAWFMGSALWGLVAGDNYGGQLSVLVLAISSVVGGALIFVGVSFIRTGIREQRGAPRTLRDKALSDDQ